MRGRAWRKPPSSMWPFPIPSIWTATSSAGSNSISSPSSSAMGSIVISGAGEPTSTYGRRVSCNMTRGRGREGLADGHCIVVQPRLLDLVICGLDGNLWYRGAYFWNCGSVRRVCTHEEGGDIPPGSSMSSPFGRVASMMSTVICGGGEPIWAMKQS